jgi:hypothetical protein
MNHGGTDHYDSGAIFTFCKSSIFADCVNGLPDWLVSYMFICFLIFQGKKKESCCFANLGAGMIEKT